MTEMSTPPTFWSSPINFGEKRIIKSLNLSELGLMSISRIKWRQEYQSSKLLTPHITMKMKMKVDWRDVGL